MLGYLASGLAAAVLLGAVLESGQDFDELPLWALFLAQVPMWAVLVYAAHRAGVPRGGLRQLTGQFRWSDLAVGLPIGIVSQALVLPLLYLPLSRFIDEDKVGESAEILTDKVDDPVAFLTLFVMAVVFAPLVEEIFYRGLVQGAFRRLSGGPVATFLASRPGAVAASAVIFAAVHFQLFDFPALVYIGVVLGALVAHYGRLGPAVWAHVGFNAFTVFVLAID